MQSDREFDDLLNRLEPFPNYFQLTIIEKSRWQYAIEKLRSERIDSSTEQSDRDCNLEGCAYYELGETGKAENKLKELKHAEDNVNNLAMMAVIYYRNGFYTKSTQNELILEKLSTEKPYSLVMAKAELAYAYSRLGAQHYKKTIELFGEVISTEVEGISEDLKFDWKFGLALTYRRCTHPSVNSLHQGIDVDMCFSKAEFYFKDIIDNNKDSDTKAKAHIELALMYTQTKYKQTSDLKNDIMNLIRKGEKLNPNDFNLLAKIGKILKLNRKFREAKEYFKKSIKIKDTSFAHHQFGLLLKGEVDYCQRNGDKRKKKSRGSKTQKHTSSVGQQAFRPRICGKDSHYEGTVTPWVRPIKCDIVTSSRDIDQDRRKSASSGERSEEMVDKLTSQASKIYLQSDDNQSDIATDEIQCTQILVQARNDLKQHFGKTTPLPIQSTTTNVYTEKKLLKSPTKSEIGKFCGTYTPKLERCIYHFEKAISISCGMNAEAEYDLGLTYLQMSPPRLNDAREKFQKLLNTFHSPWLRYRCFEQSGHCLMKMSEDEAFGNPEENRKDAYEMFKRSIRCWALCQMTKFPVFDHPNEYLQSLKSIRELMLNDFNGKREKKTLADLYFCVQEYRYSLGLYEELKNELERAGDSSDFDVTIGLINNHIEIGNYNDVLDLLNILLCSKDRNMDVIKEKLVQIIEHSIRKNDSATFCRVLEINRSLTCPNSDEEDSVYLSNYDIAIIHDKSLQNTYYEEIYSCLAQIRGLNITRNDQDVPVNRYRMSGLASIIEHSCLVMFIFDDKDAGSNFLQEMFEIAVNAKVDANVRLSKIISVSAGDGTLPKWLRNKGKQMVYTKETDKQQWFREVCNTLIGRQ